MVIMKINNEIINRQKRLLSALGDKAVAIVFSAKEPKYHRKTVYPYRQDSNFYYLTGITESDSVAVFVPNRKQGEYVFFSRKPNPEDDLWVGGRIGQEKACKEYGADQAFPIEEMNKIIPNLIGGNERVYFNIGDHRDYEFIMHWLKLLNGKERAGVNVPEELVDLGKIVHEMRLIKNKGEIEVMKKAAEITAKAQLRAMQKCQTGMMEYELEAEIIHEFMRQGGRFPAFEPIIAGGANACTLHYTDNHDELKNGDLVLVDIGVEYGYYAGDITRTFPVNGRFNEKQRAIYQAVLDVQLAVIENIGPGVQWFELHKLSERLITEKLLELKLLKGKLKKLLAESACKQFYMHYIGHWLGLDAHDPSKYKKNNGTWRGLEENMVITVEPGIYVRQLGIGVRIEDDVLITKDGCEILSSAVPKSIDEIEAIMAH